MEFTQPLPLLWLTSADSAKADSIIGMPKTSPSSIVARLHRLDLFIATTVITIVVIRLFLELTGYPQIGGDDLHVAHMLWGGLLLAGTFLYVLLSGRPNKARAALFGGVGFGVFIDELGKFVTTDNNYFFNPTFFIIYLLLLVIWFVARTMIVTKNHLPFLSTVTWPKHTYQRVFILLFCAVQIIVGFTFVYTYLKNGQIFGASGLFGLLCASTIATVTFLYTVGLYKYTHGQPDRAGYLIRIGALGLLTVVYPFVFLHHQAWAFLGGILTILVAIGLSAISLHSLIMPIFKQGT